MFAADTVKMLRERIETVTGVALPYDIQTGQSTAFDLEVDLCGGSARIACREVNALCRGLFLLCRCVREGREELHVKQSRRFESCGAMLDCSRNAVMKVSSVKRYIHQLAALGMNMLMLYTEDTYEVPGYPYMGYLRGRYSQDELREIDEYAASMGVELVPCIQTLGHMAQFLQWPDNEAMRDQMDVLLADDEQTLRLIQAQIASVSSCIRSRRIHIGMDEAHGVGLGRYLLQNGMTDRHELLRRHLERVVDICKQYDYRPIMWSDMFFRLGSKTNDYYDPQAVVPQSVIDALPDVDMCYWDYYHTDTALYEHMLREHARMGENTVFAGGLWTWSGFLPHVKYAERSMLPALQVAAKHRVRTVFATLWGDDGAETNPFLASGLLPIFSEACWQGVDVAREEVVLCGECLTGLPRQTLDAMGEFYGDNLALHPGKALVWCDPLYPLLDLDEEPLPQAIARADGALSVLRLYPQSEECRYAGLLFEIVREKAELLLRLRERYLAGDRAYLSGVRDEVLPRLTALYDRLMRAHRAMWERDMKRFGWEVLALRYGAAIGRLADVQEEIGRFLCGELDCIEELEPEPLAGGRPSQAYFSFVTPSVVY